MSRARGHGWEPGAAGSLTCVTSGLPLSARGLIARSPQQGSQTFSHGDVGLPKGEKQKLPGLLMIQARD